MMRVERGDTGIKKEEERRDGRRERDEKPNERARHCRLGGRTDGLYCTWLLYPYYCIEIVHSTVRGLQTLASFYSISLNEFSCTEDYRKTVLPGVVLALNSSSATGRLKKCTNSTHYSS